MEARPSWAALKSQMLIEMAWKREGLSSSIQKWFLGFFCLRTCGRIQHNWAVEKDSFGLNAIEIRWKTASVCNTVYEMILSASRISNTTPMVSTVKDLTFSCWV